MRARSGETRGCLRGSPPLRTVVSCVTEPQPDPGAAGGTPEPAVRTCPRPYYISSGITKSRSVPRRVPLGVVPGIQLLAVVAGGARAGAGLADARRDLDGHLAD